MKLGNVEVGPGLPTRFVAEISNNHNGSEERAVRLMEAAKRAGADFVKFQAYTPAELVALRGDGSAPEPWGSQGYVMSTLYERARTPLEWLPGLFAYARTLGLEPFASVFGPDSLAAVEACYPCCYKIAALDGGNVDLAAIVAETGRPVILSHHAPSRSEMPHDLQLYCPPGYPQVGPFDWDVWRRGDAEGFSYHGRKGSDGAFAANRGAQLVEAHFQLETERGDLEEAVSLTEFEFRVMVDVVRTVERAA